ncbi:MAG: helix-turn-helix domain-containing protein [Treponema sp.]|nr:helix-turn-helix domain-containing protein [Treponema sp.]
MNKTPGCRRSLYNKTLAERSKAYEALKDGREALSAHTYKTGKEYKQECEFL